MFKVDLLPAGRGDSIWIEYGDRLAPHRVLVDGGVRSTVDAIRARLEAIAPGQRRIDLLVVSHIDVDHIAGILELLRRPPDGLAIGDIWFNGWKHLPSGEDVLGPPQGERLSARLVSNNLPWNAAFGGRGVAIEEGESCELPVRELAGGMRLTLLAPTLDRLRRLRPVWEHEIRKNGLEPGSGGTELEVLAHPEDVDAEGMLGPAEIDVDALARSPFNPDTSEANGSSIALLAEYDGRRCLLGGDAFAGDLARSIRTLIQARGGSMLALDAFKLSHHGGRKNTSTALLDLLACRRYLVSTDGSYYKHPTHEVISRIIVHGRQAGTPSLFFNFRTAQNEVWGDRILMADHDYAATYPSECDQGISVDL